MKYIIQVRYLNGTSDEHHYDRSADMNADWMMLKQNPEVQDLVLIKEMLAGRQMAIKFWKNKAEV